MNYLTEDSTGRIGGSGTSIRAGWPCAKLTTAI